MYSQPESKYQILFPNPLLSTDFFITVSENPNPPTLAFAVINPPYFLVSHMKLIKSCCLYFQNTIDLLFNHILLSSPSPLYNPLLGKTSLPWLLQWASKLSCCLHLCLLIVYSQNCCGLLTHNSHYVVHALRILQLP